MIEESAPTTVAPENAGDTPPDTSAPPRETPPRRDSPHSPPRERPRSPRESPVTRPRKPNLKQALLNTFNGISIAIMATGDEYCATVVASNAEPLADAWFRLAQVNPRVQALLERMIEGGAYGGVVIATAATMIPIAFHHGLWPKQLPPPYLFGLGPEPPPSPEVRQEQERQHGDSPTDSGT